MDDYVFVTVLITTTTPTTYNFSMPSKSQKNKQTNKSQKKINKQRKQARRIWLPLLVFTLYPPCFFRCHNSVRILTLNPPPPHTFPKSFPPTQWWQKDMSLKFFCFHPTVQSSFYMSVRSQVDKAVIFKKTYMV